MNKTVVKYLALSSLALGGLVYSTETAHAEEASVTRIEGANRFETAANISQNSYDKADTVIIVNARGFADALAGAPLAYQKNAPILLAQGSSLHSATIDEIERLEATNAIILGGEAAVSEGISNELDNLGLGVERIAGDNRFDTAEKIADSLGGLVQSDKAVVVDGFEFADAMSVAPFAAREGMPIFLTRTNSLTSEDALANFDQTYIIGGEHAVSSTVEDQLNNPMRLEGANRYATNLAVMDYFEINADQLFISTGLDYVDALTGSVLAAQNNSGVALVRNGVSSSLKTFINSQLYNLTVFGGEAAVSGPLFEELGSLLSEANSDAHKDEDSPTTNLEFNQTDVRYIKGSQLPDGSFLDDRMEVTAIINDRPEFSLDDIDYLVAPDRSEHTGYTGTNGEFFGDMSNPAYSHQYMLTEWDASITWNLPINESSVGDYTFKIVDVNGAEHQLVISITAEDLKLDQDYNVEEPQDDENDYFGETPVDDDDMGGGHTPVTTTEYKYEDDVVPYDTEYIATDDLYTDEIDVVSDGQNGRSVHVYEVTYNEDGEVINRSFVRTDVTEEPVTAVVRVGSQERPIELFFEEPDRVRYISNTDADDRIHVVARIVERPEIDLDNIDYFIAPDGTVLSGQNSSPQDPTGGELFGDLSNPAYSHRYESHEWDATITWNLPVDESSIGDYTFRIVDIKGDTHTTIISVTAEDLSN